MLPLRWQSAGVATTAMERGGATTTMERGGASTVKTTKQIASASADVFGQCGGCADAAQASAPPSSSLSHMSSGRGPGISWSVPSTPLPPPFPSEVDVDDLLRRVHGERATDADNLERRVRPRASYS